MLWTPAHGAYPLPRVLDSQIEGGAVVKQKGTIDEIGGRESWLVVVQINNNGAITKREFTHVL